MIKHFLYSVLWHQPFAHHVSRATFKTMDTILFLTLQVEQGGGADTIEHNTTWRRLEGRLTRALSKNGNKKSLIPRGKGGKGGVQGSFREPDTWTELYEMSNTPPSTEEEKRAFWRGKQQVSELTEAPWRPSGRPLTARPLREAERVYQGMAFLKKDLLFSLTQYIGLRPTVQVQVRWTKRHRHSRAWQA